MNESNRARIPVRPLPYTDKDLAMTRELIIDYDKGNIFITDKDDPTILIDITKLIAESYLSNINGDNTNVTINGEVYNLAELLAELSKSKITILNSADSQAVPASINYDHQSVTIYDNTVSLFGFQNAANNSKPMKKDGTLVWLSPEDEGDPGEPQPGANINVIDIIPTNNSIILYAKPFMNTIIETSPIASFMIKLPKSQPKFTRIKWKLDTAIELFLLFSSNITWIDDDIMGTPIEKHISAKSTYLIEMETWDFGETWIVISSLMFPLYSESESDLPPGQTYLTDQDGALLAYEDNVLLVTGDETFAASYTRNGIVKQIPTLMPKTTKAVATGARGAYFIKKITDLQTVDGIDSSMDKLFLNKEGNAVQVIADEVSTKVSSAGDVPYENTGVTNVEEALDKLLHVPVTVKVTSSHSFVQQKGAVLKSFQIRWEFSNSKNIQSISLNGIDLPITARSYTEEVDISAKKEYWLTYHDGIKEYTLVSIINFYTGIYYGTSASTDYNGDLINSLSRSLQSSNSIKFNVNALEGEYIYYACPTSYGQPIFTISGLDVIYDKMIEFDFINSDGYSEQYAIYRSTYAGLGRLSISSR